MNRALLTLLLVCFLITASAAAAPYERLEGVITVDTLVHNVIKIEAEEEVFVTAYSIEEKLTLAVKPPNANGAVIMNDFVNGCVYSGLRYDSGAYYVESFHRIFPFTNKSTYRALSRFT